MDTTTLSNRPPLADQLAIRHQDLVDEIALAIDGITVPDMSSDEDVAAARDIVKPLVALQNRCTDAYRREKDPVLEDGRTIEAFFESTRHALDTLVDGFKARANAWQTKKRQEAAQLEAAKRRIATAMAEPAPAPPPPKETVRVATASGIAASGRVTWDYEVVDVTALPRELLMPNKGAIKGAIAAIKARGTKIDDAAIPGLRIFEKVSGTTWR